MRAFHGTAENNSAETRTTDYPSDGTTEDQRL